MFAQGAFLQAPGETTPERIARNRKILEGMLKSGGARYATEGLFKGLSSIVGGIGMARQNRLEREGQEDWFNGLFGGGDAAMQASYSPASGGYTGGSGGAGSGFSGSRPAPDPNPGFGLSGQFTTEADAPLTFGMGDFDGETQAFMLPQQFEPLPIAGAVDGVDPSLVDMASRAWGYVLPGGNINVTTGVSSHSPTNHAPGHAIDFQVTRPDGSVVRASDPEMLQAAQIGRALGVHGIGYGEGPTGDYMGGVHSHWDISRNGPRTWGDDDGGTSDRYGAGSAEHAAAISAATGRPVEEVLAQLGIEAGDPEALTFGPTAERDFQMAALSPQAGAPAPRATVPAPEQFASIADIEAQRAGVDPNLFRALVTQESAWRPDAVSPVGAFGLTQAMPNTARSPGFGVAPLTSTNDPREQLRFGADYLAAMLERYGGDVPRALAAYNWGPGNADNWNGDLASLPEETRNYIQRITGMTGGLETTMSARNPDVAAVEAARAPVARPVAPSAPARAPAPSQPAQAATGGADMLPFTTDPRFPDRRVLRSSGPRQTREFAQQLDEQGTPYEIERMGGGGFFNSLLGNMLGGGRQEQSAPVNASTQGRFTPGNQPAGQPARSGGGITSMSIDELYAAAMSPWAPSEVRPMLMAEIERRTQAQDPMRQLQLERAQLEIEQMRNPQPAELPADVREIQWRAEQAGLAPGTPEYQQFVLTGGSTPLVDFSGANIGGAGTNFGQDYFKDRYGELQTQAASASQMLGMYDIAEQALTSGLRTGFGAEAEQSLRRIGQALGMDVDQEALAGGELLTSVTNRMALQMRNPDSGMGMPGAVSDRDLTFLKDAQIGIDRSPEGNARMLRAFRALEERKVELAEMADAYINQYGRLDTGFNQMVRDHALANPLFSEDMFADIGPSEDTGDIGGETGSRVDPATRPSPSDGLPRVSSPSEYDALLPGSVYVDPNGNVRQKPGGPTQ